MKRQAGFDLIPSDDAVFFELYTAVRGEELGMQEWDPALRALYTTVDAQTVSTIILITAPPEITKRRQRQTISI